MKKGIKKKVVLISIIAVVVVVIILIAMPSIRIVSAKNLINRELSEYDEDKDIGFSFAEKLPEDIVENSSFLAYIDNQVKELFKEKNYRKLDSFLFECEELGFEDETLEDTVKKCYEEIGDIESALLLFRWLDDYNVELRKDKGVIAAYIKENGTQPVTTKKGEGYYADKKDYVDKDTVGLHNSPLYDAKEYKFFGDFKSVRKYGVKLNSWYEETNYSYEAKYCFRDKGSFESLNGEFIWSGDYLFQFMGNSLVEYTGV